MSFLDERDNPAQGREAPGAAPREPRPRGSGGPPGPGSRPPRPGRGTDAQTLLVRRSIAIGAGVVALVLVVLLVRGCLEAREQRAFEDYLQEASALVGESSSESEALFELLEDPGDQSAVDVQNALNGFSVDAERLVERAESVEPPDELADAHELVTQTLALRHGGLEGVAGHIPAALGDEQRGEAIEAIAVDMRSFLASDVIYDRQALPAIEAALEDAELADELGEVPDSEFLPGIEWLDPAEVRGAVQGIGGEEPATAGLHGTGIAAVTVAPSGTTLTEGVATEVPLAEGLAFDVQIENQGESEESDIGVTVTLEGGEEPIVVEGTLESVAVGAIETISLALEQQPPAGEELELTVEVEPVPGEENADNNEGTYPVMFVE